MNLQLALAAPFGASLLSLFLAGRDRPSAARITLVLSFLVAAVSLPLAGHAPFATPSLDWFVLPGIGTKITWQLAVDGVSGWLVALLSLLVPAVLWTSRETSGDRHREFAVLIFLMQGTIVGTLLSGDLFMMYLFFEAMLLPSVLLTALFGGRERKKAALLFLGLSLVGSAPLFIAIWWMATIPPVNGIAVSFSLTATQTWLGAIPPNFRQWLFIAMVLAFVVKLPLVPFHIWQAPAYSQGPAGSSALLTGVMAKVGLWGFFRLLIPLFPIESSRSADIFVVLGILTVLIGALLALQQTEIRRVLAFSSLSHLGLGVAGLFTFRPEAQGAVLLLMVAHGLSSATLFMLAGIVERWKNSSHIDDFGDLASHSPVFATFFILAALASVGLPGTAGFVAEFLLLASLFKVYGVWVALVAGVTVVLSAAYTLKLVQKLLFGRAALPASEHPQELQVGEAFLLAPLLLLTVVLGFYPAPVLRSVPPKAFHSLAASATSTPAQEEASHAPGR